MAREATAASQPQPDAMVDTTTPDTHTPVAHVGRVDASPSDALSVARLRLFGQDTPTARVGADGSSPPVNAQAMEQAVHTTGAEAGSTVHAEPMARTASPQPCTVLDAASSASHAAAGARILAHADERAGEGRAGTHGAAKDARAQEGDGSDAVRALTDQLRALDLATASPAAATAVPAESQLEHGELLWAHFGVTFSGVLLVHVWTTAVLRACVRLARYEIEHALVFVVLCAKL